MFRVDTVDRFVKPEDFERVDRWPVDRALDRLPNQRVAWLGSAGSP